MFSDTANNTGLIQDITFWLGVDTNAYPLKDRTRAINERFKMVWSMIFESSDGWKFMDDNTSDTTTGVPYADSSIVSGTGLYALPSASLAVNGVQIKTSSTDNFTVIKAITEKEFIKMGGDGYFSSNGTTLYYMLQGDVIRLLPTPNFSVTDGLRVFFDQSISEFSYSDTSKTPGFASVFHRALSVGAALDYAMARGLQSKVVFLKNLWDDYERRIREYYSKRLQSRYPHSIIPGNDLVDENT